MGKVFEDELSTAWFKLQQIRFKVFSQIKNRTAVMDLEGQSTESRRTFYLLSLILMISILFLSPDKLWQAFLPAQAENEVFEWGQETAKIIKRFVSDIVHA